jgi:hypothetical protein
MLPISINGRNRNKPSLGLRHVLAVLGLVFICVQLLTWGYFFHAINEVDKLEDKSSLTSITVDHGIDARNARPHLHSIPKSEKVAILVMYVGPTLPPYFELFLFTAQFSADIFDWFIFVTEPQSFSTPHNVHIIHISVENLLSRLIRVDGVSTSNGSISLDYWTQTFRSAVSRYPYLLVEFKPCLGWAFQVSEMMYQDDVSR